MKKLASMDTLLEKKILSCKKLFHLKLIQAGHIEKRLKVCCSLDFLSVLFIILKAVKAFSSSENTQHLFAKKYCKFDSNILSDFPKLRSKISRSSNILNLTFALSNFAKSIVRSFRSTFWSGAESLQFVLWAALEWYKHNI